MSKNYLDTLHGIAKSDADKLLVKEKEYDGSWKKRGGIGAFMMLARKWDRIEAQVTSHGYDVFKAFAADQRSEGIIDDIGDLRRYLLLVEAWISSETEAERCYSCDARGPLFNSGTGWYCLTCVEMQNED